MPEENESLNRSTVSGSIAKFASAIGGFIGRTLFARIIGPLEFGGFFFIYSAVQILDWPLSGWSTATKKRLSEKNSARDEIFSAQVLANAAWLVVSTLPAYLFRGEFREITGIQSAPLLFILLMIHVSTFNPLLAILFAEEKVGRAMWFDTLRGYLTLILQGVFVYYGFAAVGMAYGTALGTSLVSLIIFSQLQYDLVLPKKQTLHDLWEYAKFSSITQLLGKSYDRFDMILIGFFVSPTAVGYYEAANILTLPAMFVAETASSGLLPFISKKPDSTEEISQQVSQSLSLSSLLAVAIFFGALSISQSLVATVFGEEYRQAAELLAVIALYKLVKSQSRPLVQVVNGFDRPDINVRISVVTMAINIVLGIWLVLIYGAVGVAVATVIAECARYILVKKAAESFISNTKMVTPQHLIQVGAGVLMFGVVWYLRNNLIVRSWVEVALLIVSGGVIYTTTIVVFDEGIRNMAWQAIANMRSIS